MLKRTRLVWLLLLIAPSLLAGSPKEEEEEENMDLTVADEDVSDQNSYQEQDVFVPTKEWQTIREGQHIPPGLHVRMNLQTGLKEAKLLDDNMETSEPDPMRDLGDSSTSGKGQRTQLYGSKSDRRGVVNKRTKVFSAGEVANMLDDINDDITDMNNLPQIASVNPSTADTGFNHAANQEHAESNNKDPSVPAKDLPVTLHGDVADMLGLSRVLSNSSSSVSELCRALEELEDHVHQIDNAMDLNGIGGLVLVVRLLNHTHPDVKSWAAHVIGSASQR